MICALTLGNVMEFFLKCGLIFAGLYVIIVLTPKLAAWIDKVRAQNKSPYESAPDPARVDDEALNDDENEKTSCKEETESNIND